MSIQVLDPTYGDAASEFVAARRLDSLEGATVGVISNGKQNTAVFFDALATALQRDHGVGEVVRTVKSNYSAPADAHIVDRAKEWNALVAGIGD